MAPRPKTNLTPNWLITQRYYHETVIKQVNRIKKSPNKTFKSCKKSLGNIFLKFSYTYLVGQLRARLVLSGEAAMEVLNWNCKISSHIKLVRNKN